MGLAVTRTGGLASRVMDAAGMREIAVAVRTAVNARTFVRGHGLTDAPMRAYSTLATSISFASETGRRLKPKGGLPAYGRGHPRRLIVNGRAPKGWRIVGRHYPGGYAEYKTASTKGGQGVTLILSGQMQREFRVKQVTATFALVGFTGGSLQYGPHVNADRPFLGISPADARALAEPVRAAIAGAMNRSRK